VRCYWPAVEGTDAETFCRTVSGRRLQDVRRHGKYLFLLLSGGLTVGVHLRMTGQLFLAEKERARDAHTHLELLVGDSDQKLVYRDVRKFGRFTLLHGGVEELVASKGLGPDALTVSPEQLLARFSRTSRGIKSVLLDQHVLAGLGNIYTDEALFRAGVSPWCRARELAPARVAELAAAIRELLYAAIAASGTTISDYVDLSGRQGSFQFSLQVYQRAGAPCPRCGATIHKGRAAGRGTYYCPACQPADRCSGCSRGLVDKPPLW
jgi:formamidopyrimidine-DNA glycosylase